MPATSNVKQEAEDDVIFLGFAADELVGGHSSKAQPLVADIRVLLIITFSPIKH